MKLSATKWTGVAAMIVFLVTIIFSPEQLQAQETRGTIKGTVIDQNKASLPGASVKINDVARGTTVTLTTNEDGFYQATYLLPGTYQIIVETTGFKKYIRDNVILQIGQTASIDIQLEVGGSQETVNVTTENPPLETAKADLGQTIDAKRIAELPLVHGDPYTLIGLSPGATYTGSTRLDRPFEPTHIVGFAVDGTRGNRSDLTIDGVPSTATANANEVIASYVPPTDIVQEFKVQTATFDAQFGNTEGGVTSISIKSGTNDFHGSAYYFLEPGGIAANDVFGKGRGQARPFSFSNRPGFSINGPVRIPYIYNGKDKTFFLFGFEAIRDSRPRFDAGASVWVPTADIASGNFSAYQCPAPPAPQTNCINIYDPLTRVQSGSNFVGTQFPNNIIPANRISEVAKRTLTYLAKPKQPGLVGNIFDSTLTEVTKPYNNFTFRVDQNIGDKHHLFVRGSYYDRNSIYNDYTASAYSGVNFVFKARQGVVDYVHTINSTTLLNLRYGYNRFIRGQDQEPDAQGFDLTQLGFSAAYNNLIPEEVRRFPRFDFTGGTLSNGMSNEFRPVDTHSYAAIMNKAFGTHSLKFGGELRIYREDDSFASNDQTGQFAFDNTYTRQSTATSADFNGLQAFAAFLLGYPSSQQIVRRADYSEYSKTYGFFIQDDWRFNRKLSFNLGLRYELETPLVERQNKSVSGFDFDYIQPVQATVRTRLAASPVTYPNSTTVIDPNAYNVRGSLLFAGKDTGKGLYNTPKNTFLPRFGVAYQINDKTVLRGGFGLFAGFLGERRGDVIQPGFTRTTALSLTRVNGNPNDTTSAQIPQPITNFPNIIIQEPVGNAQGRQTGLGGAISFFNQNPKISKQARFQIGIQRELPWGVVAEAVYVGNYGYNIEIAKNINALPNQYLSTDNSRTTAMTNNNNALTVTTGISNPFFGLPEFAGTSLGTSSTISRSQLLRPFPAYTDIITTNNDGKSWYHSGQFSLQKRFSKGYTFQASYTWSKWIQATEYLNPADPEPTKMISDQDVPHRFSFSAMYQLPFGKGQPFFANTNGVVDRIIGGWQLGGVYVFQSGFPVAFGSFNITSGATSGDLFYRGGRISIDNPEVGNWFNTAAFTSVVNGATANEATPVSHLRTLPYRFSDVRLDPINNFDFSLLKDIRVREEMKIQIRFELINAFNHPLLNSGLVVSPTAVNSNPLTPGTRSAFGQINASNQNNYARRAQIGIKFIF